MADRGTEPIGLIKAPFKEDLDSIDGEKLSDICEFADSIPENMQDPADPWHCDIEKCKTAGGICTAQKTQDGKSYYCYTNLDPEHMNQGLKEACVYCTCAFKVYNGSEGA